MRNEERLPSSDGPPRIYDTYKSPIFNGDGTRKGIVVIGRDISERVWAEEALRRSEARLRLILETTVDLIGLVAPDGTVEFINSAVEELFGVSRDEIIGCSFVDPRWKYLASDGREMPIAMLPVVRARSAGQVRGAELVVEPLGGRRVVLSVNATALDDPKGAVVFAASDITRRVAVERMKSDFLRIASHELRTPLTPLRLLIDKIKRSIALGESVDLVTIERMDRQVFTLTQLVNDLLDVARLERGQFLAAPRTEVDLAALVADVVADFRLQARGSIELQIPSTDVIVSANRWALERVVGNLLDNALKYGGTDVEVRVSVTDDRVQLSVSDHGPGIGPEQRARLFDRFYRAASESSVRMPGLGLGLFISRELLRELGSDIELESERGKGSTFRFTLPRHRASAG